MKNIKRGFSLAEVLIAVTIAAIIATMGFTIAKKGIERAYNRYIYTGYYAIASVLDHTKYGRGFIIRECVEDTNLGDTDNCDFSKEVVEALSGRHVGGNEATANILDFDTPNGINYRIMLKGTLNEATDEEQNPLNTYLVRMRVPSAKTREANSRTICTVYIENFASADSSSFENILIPYNGDADCSANLDENTIIQGDIQDRMDLLAFYLDDNKRGKVVDGEYQQRVFRNAKEAMCLKYRDTNGNAPESISSYLNCTGVIDNLSPSAEDWERNQQNLLVITDPRRI